MNSEADSRQPKVKPHKYVYGSPKRSRKPVHTLNPESKKTSTDNFFEYNKKIRKYPWELWMDGSWWECVRGTDYTITTLNFLRTLQVVATRYGYRVQSCRVSHGRSVIFQFYKGPKRKHLISYALRGRDVKVPNED